MKYGSVEKNEITHFAFASDEKFVTQLLVSVMSLLKSSVGLPKTQVIHILDCGIGNDVWRKINGRILAFADMISVGCEVCKHDIDMSLFQNFRMWNNSRAAYARLMLPMLLPDVRYCVYSDCDVLFFENPWELVNQLKQNGVAILGHKNPPDRNGVNIDERWFVTHNEPYNPYTYFCSGLIGMDLDKFRAPGVLESMFDFLSRHTDVVSADQTALNWYFRDDSALASEGWGVFPMECFGDKYEIKAIHYVGGFPWKACRTWYMYFMFNRLDNIWIAFARRVLGSEFLPRHVSMLARLVGNLACIATRILIVFRIPIVGKKDYLNEAGSVIFRHEAIDRAAKKLLAGLP